MEAIKVTRQNLAYVVEYVVKNAPWAVDFMHIFESNLAKREWTVVYTYVRQTGFGPKTIYGHLTETTFNERFEFVSIQSPYDVTPITKK